MRHRNPGQSLSAIRCRIITQDDAKLMLIFVNITNTVISTKIWLLHTLKSISTGLGQILHPFLSPFHICNQSNILKPSHITGTICLLEQFTVYPNQMSHIKTETAWSSGKNNKAHYMVKTQKMTIMWIRGTTESLWMSTCSTSQCNCGHTATVNPQHCIPLITAFLTKLYSRCLKSKHSYIIHIYSKLW